MKSMRPPLVAICFMTNFYRAGGGHGPSPPSESATVGSLGVCRMCVLVIRFKTYQMILNYRILERNTRIFLKIVWFCDFFQPAVEEITSETQKTSM